MVDEFTIDWVRLDFLPRLEGARHIASRERGRGRWALARASGPCNHRLPDCWGPEAHAETLAMRPRSRVDRSFRGGSAHDVRPGERRRQHASRHISTKTHLPIQCGPPRWPCGSSPSARRSGQRSSSPTNAHIIGLTEPGITSECTCGRVC